jgi:tetratricopeptide (TPR) repeat protein
MKYFGYFLTTTLLSCWGCSGFLDEKPSKDLVVPNTVQDLRGLMDNQSFRMNNSPGLQLAGTDDVWTTEEGLAGYNSVETENAYLWNEVVFEGPKSADWETAYRQIFYANVVLDEADKIRLSAPGEEAELNEVKGTAYFLRARALFDMMELFAAPYFRESGDGLGVVIRTRPIITEARKRSSAKECFDQILDDLEKAVALLPSTSLFPTRPTQAAAYGMQARVNLVLGDFGEAYQSASNVLESGLALMDYSQVDSLGAFPFEQFNQEVIYHTTMTLQAFHSSNLTFVDSALISSYESGDYRKTLYYRESGAGGYNFRGSYAGDNNLFSGIALDEIYLILAECAVRLNRLDEGLEFLNGLLETRFSPGSFEPVTTLSQQELLAKIMEERRKELVFRGRRWSDLRRLNTDPSFAKTLKRSLQGNEYVLLPGSARYVFPIPQEEIVLNGLQQNPR